MIDTTNFKPLTAEQRKLIIERALHTQPYFYKMEFPVITGNTKDNQYGSIVGINRDFILTEFMSNFGEAFPSVDSTFDVSLYSGYLNSLYRFEASQKIPSGFVFQEARYKALTNAQKFVDTQFEIMPLKIPNGDYIYCDIRNNTAKKANFAIYAILKGFTRLKDAYLSPIETERINKSLNTETRFEYFKFEVRQNGKETFVFENDSTPRLILAFGASNTTIDKAVVSESYVSITDDARRAIMTDTKIPVQFIAPRLTCLLDAHKYMLPVEYYVPPLAKINFDIENIYQNDSPQGYDFNILTRTV